ncbi:MAG: dephospho-CoA kinase [Pseudomonadota bacterium]|nr:dephospho-CoA kinase [Pseudomonadota bacterium]
MLRIALTGGIGSGKSAVTNHLRALGATVLDADEFSHQVTAKGSEVLERIGEAFGLGVLTPDGSLDRAALRQLVFDDATARAQLETILHPDIRRRMREAAAQTDAPYCVFSIPLLIETGRTKEFDRVLVVEAPASLRRERTAHRSNLDRKQIDAIIAAQASDEDRRRAADDLIINDGSLDSLGTKVKELHQQYLELASQPVTGPKINSPLR